MDCERVTVPAGTRLVGWTATGRRVPIAPGDYVVHRLRPRMPPPGVGETLRFVGADPHGGDVHVALPSAGRLPPGRGRAGRRRGRALLTDADCR
jgi:hypothetical protein